MELGSHCRCLACRGEREGGGSPQVSTECAPSRPRGHIFPFQKGGGRRSPEPRATPGPSRVRPRVSEHPVAEAVRETSL